MKIKAKNSSRLAFQALFQLDARAHRGVASEALIDEIRLAIAEPAASSPREVDEAMRLALEAYAARDDADAVMRSLAPDWPASRQPAVDRAILRLAYHRLTLAEDDDALIISEAIELAKAYSTQKSPGFVNALLDRAKDRLRAASQDAQP